MIVVTFYKFVNNAGRDNYFWFVHRCDQIICIFAISTGQNVDMLVV